MTWAIAKWGENYETYESRRLKSMPWVRLPCDLASSGYVEMLTEHEDGEAHFGAWVAVLELAVRCPERGVLTRSNGRPHTVKSMAAVTRFREATIDAMLGRAVDMGWATMTQDDEITQIARPKHADSPTKTRGREDKRREDKRKTEYSDDESIPVPAKAAKMGPPMDDIADLYHDILVPPLPKLRCGIPASARRNVTARWKAHPSLREWREVFDTVSSSPFLLGNNDRGWKATLIWIVKAENWDKIQNDTYSTTEGGVAANDVGDAIMENARKLTNEQRQRAENDGDGRRLEITGGGIPDIRREVLEA